jgi:co-chaperonin GroES (HSP10)
VRLLRGRVAIRPIVDKQVGSILMPDTHGDWSRKGDRSQGVRTSASHRATVLGFGLPALEHGHELPHGFVVGDEVLFTWHINEKWSDGQVWEDGEPCVFISQEMVNAVVERSK